MRVLLAILGLTTCAAVAATTITYQGQLQDVGGPFDGSVDMTFQIYDEETGGNPVGIALDKAGVSVIDGLFQVELDFGDPPYDSGLWMQITVAGETLAPRQRISAAPLAVRALSAASGGPWIQSGDNIFFGVTGDGRAAIGTNIPQARLHVVSTDNTLGVRVATDNTEVVLGSPSVGDAIVASTSESGGWAVGANCTSGECRAVRAHASSATGFGVYATGVAGSRSYFQHPVAIGNINPQRQLHVRQTTNVNSTSGITLQRTAPADEQWGLYVSTSNNFVMVYDDSSVGNFNPSTGIYTATSDGRLKQDIESLDGVLDRFLQLKPSSYRMVSAGDNGERRVGLIAQEVQALFPEVVTYLDEDQSDYLGISYDEVATLNTQALIELNARYESIVRQQQERIAALESELNRQRADTAERLAALEALLLDGTEVAVSR